MNAPDNNGAIILNNILIHIGYPKSGSTYIQDVVFNRPEAKLFKQPDMTYLKTGEPFDPRLLRASMTPEEETSFAEHTLTVVSQEKFSGFLDGAPHGDAFQIANRLHAAYPEAKILIVTRNQRQYTLSLYCWRVIQRGLETRPLPVFLDKLFESQLKHKLAYHVLAEHYIKLFGRERVKVVPVEWLSRDVARFWESLCSFSGIPNVNAPPTHRVNETRRSVSIVNWCRRINRVLNIPLLVARPLVSKRMIRRMRQALIRTKRTRLLPLVYRIADPSSADIDLPASWITVYQEEFAGSNRKLEAITGEALSGLGYPT